MPSMPMGLTHMGLAVSSRKKEAKPSLWQTILSEHSRATTTATSTLVVLGRPNVGKRGLIQGLRTAGSPPDNPPEALEKAAISAVDFAYCDVRASDDGSTSSSSDVVGRINIWLIDDVAFKPMLRSRIKRDVLQNLCVVICLDMREPWTIMEDLRTWMEVVTNEIAPTLTELPLKEQEELKQRMEAYCEALAAYIADPSSTTNGGEHEHGFVFARKSHHHSSENEKKESHSGKKVEEVPLPPTQHQDSEVQQSPRSEANDEGEKKDGEDDVEKDKEEDTSEQKSSSSPPASTFFNFGFPVIVVLCQADIPPPPEFKGHQKQQDLVQAYLRQYCLKYQATLLYTSLLDQRNPKNVSLLYRYIAHRLYDLPLLDVPELSSRDAIFIPAGSDSKDKLQGIAEKIGGLAEPFDTRVQRQKQNTAVADEAIVETESLSAFLTRAQSVLEVASSAKTMLKTNHETGRKAMTSASATAAKQQAEQAKKSQQSSSGGASGAPENPPLTSFFHTLIQKGGTAAGGAPAAAKAKTAAAPAPQAKASPSPPPASATPLETTIEEGNEEG